MIAEYSFKMFNHMDGTVKTNDVFIGMNTLRHFKVKPGHKRTLYVYSRFAELETLKMSLMLKMYDNVIYKDWVSIEQFELDVYNNCEFGDGILVGDMSVVKGRMSRIFIGCDLNLKQINIHVHNQKIDSWSNEQFFI
jgi:hypothetical protein